MKYIYVLLLLNFISHSSFSQKVDYFYNEDSTVVDKKEYYDISNSTPNTYYYLDVEIDSGLLRLYKDKETNILLLEKKVINDSLFIYQYYETGVLKFLTVQYGYKLIYDRAWCPNGLLIRSVIYSEEPSDITNYYCSGIKRNQFTLKRVILIGTYQSWHENGIIESKGFYNNKGKKHELWQYYYKTGKLQKEEFWDKGELKEVKKYSMKGKLIKD